MTGAAGAAEGSVTTGPVFAHPCLPSPVAMSRFDGVPCTEVIAPDW